MYTHTHTHTNIYIYTHIYIYIYIYIYSCESLSMYLYKGGLKSSLAEIFFNDLISHVMQLNGFLSKMSKLCSTNSGRVYAQRKIYRKINLTWLLPMRVSWSAYEPFTQHYLSIYLSIIYLYIYMCVCVYIYIYI